MTIEDQVPALAGVHHLKLPVRDLVRSRDWYASRLGYELETEFVEDGTLMGLGLRHPNGGPSLALRLDPARAEAAPASTTSPSASPIGPPSRPWPGVSPTSARSTPASTSPPSAGSCRCSTTPTATRSGSTRLSTTRTRTPTGCRPSTVPGRRPSAGAASTRLRAPREPHVRAVLGSGPGNAGPARDSEDSEDQQGGHSPDAAGDRSPVKHEPACLVLPCLRQGEARADHGPRRKNCDSPSSASLSVLRNV